MALAIVLVSAGCSGLLPRASSVGLENPAEESAKAAQQPESQWGSFQPPIEGRLRILVPADHGPARLPRRGDPRRIERALALEFAASRGLEPIVISLPNRDDLIPALLAGWGDIVVARLTITRARAEVVAFTDPVAQAREQIVTRTDDLSLRDASGLTGRRLALRAASSFVESASALFDRIPGLEREIVPGHLDSEEILVRVSTGEYDVAIADSDLVETILTYRPDLRVAFDVSPERDQAWAVRREDSALLDDLNEFLRDTLPSRLEKRSRADLPDIKMRKSLRVLTRNSGATYFVYRGQLLGFEYELAERFAKSQGLYLELVVPPTRTALIPWLREGRGDLIAASLTPTRERDVQEIAFSSPYKWTREVIVTRSDDSSLRSRADLAGRTIVVRRSSSYWERAMSLRAEGIEVDVIEAPEELETEEIIARVESGQYDLTIADDHIVDIELAWRSRVRAAFPLSSKLGHRWVVRKESRELLSAVDAFLAREIGSNGIGSIIDRYFSSPRRTKRYLRSRLLESGTISPYDEAIKKYASEFGIDWRLVAAQMYQESRFDPNALSPAGALGLMQFMPRTARRYGLEDRAQPEASIRAGVRYLTDLRDEEYANLPAGERLWFALAAYNAGPEHVADARQLARELGMNPKLWFGHVEESIQLLARRRYYRRARYGYCRGSEPYAYVREIRARYEAYRSATNEGESLMEEDASG